MTKRAIRTITVVEGFFGNTGPWYVIQTHADGHRQFLAECRFEHDARTLKALMNLLDIGGGSQESFLRGMADLIKMYEPHEQR